MMNSVCVTLQFVAQLCNDAGRILITHFGESVFSIRSKTIELSTNTMYVFLIVVLNHGEYPEHTCTL